MLHTWLLEAFLCKKISRLKNKQAKAERWLVSSLIVVFVLELLLHYTVWIICTFYSNVLKPWQSLGIYYMTWDTENNLRTLTAYSGIHEDHHFSSEQILFDEDVSKSVLSSL